MSNPYKKILDSINDSEKKLSYLLNKLYSLRNENRALSKRINLLEEENELLRGKRDVTVDKLQKLLNRIDGLE